MALLKEGAPSRPLAAAEEHLDAPRLEVALLNHLGILSRKGGEWDRAIEYYEKDLEISERLGDAHGMATTWTNLGLLHLEAGRPEEAKPLLARAYRVFAQVGSPHQDKTGNLLVRAFAGDAANAYLQHYAEAHRDEEN